MLTQPTVAVLTPRGRGAIAVVHYCGPCETLEATGAEPLFRAANGRPLASQPLGRVVYGHWGATAPAESVVLCRKKEDELEIQCHGGDAAVCRILDDLTGRGARVLSWRELQAAQHGVFCTELIDALARATTMRTAAILLEQQTGVLKREIETLRGIEWSAEGRLKVARALESLVGWGRFGSHLTTPWSVVLAGRPNAGKSSLINTLVGYQRAIVFDQPGTTRDVVTAETALDGWPVQLADTAGIRDDASELEAAGIERAQVRIASADCRVLVLDTSRAFHPDDQRLLATWPDALRVAHKSDLPSVWGCDLPREAIPVSSLTGEGVAELTAAIVAALIPDVPAPQTPIPITKRQIDCFRAARNAIEDANRTAYLRALDEALR